jgi:acyl-coenzyme A thioesterase PaaI-like protein
MSDAPIYHSVAPFNNHARVEMLDAPAGEGATRIADLPELKNHFGTVHGGALFTVGEVASARAVMAALGAHLSSLHAVTRAASIRYLKAARGAVRAQARLKVPIEQSLDDLAHNGRTTLEVDVALHDDDARLVGELSVQWHVAPRRDNPAR